VRNYNHPAYRTCHLGTSGIGKTTDFLKRFKEQSAKKRFIFDHKREFSLKLGKPVCTTAAQLVHAVGHSEYILFDSAEMYPADRQAGFAFFADFTLAMAHSTRGRIIFVADELQQVAGPHDDCQEIISLLDDGRCLQVDAMLIAQSPNGINTRVRNQLTEFYCFRQADENAIKFLSDNGISESSIRSLRPGEFIWKNVNTGLVAKGGDAFEINAKGMPTGSTIIRGGECENGE